MNPTSTSRLIYDSARADAQLGLRSAVIVNRTLVFQGGDISLDVVIHAGSRANGYMHGQVIDALTNNPVPHAWVHLAGAEAPVRTDEMGQFAVGVTEQDGGLRLEVETGSARMHCVVPFVDSYGAPTVG